MLRKLTEHEAAGGSGLNPSAQAAVQRLAGA
jgi:hypothetical protein